MTERRADLEQEFAKLHAELRRDAGTRAAHAILELLRGKPAAAAAT